jgi:hypothetical protein
VLALALVALHLLLVTDLASSEQTGHRLRHGPELKRLLDSDECSPGLLSAIQAELKLVRARREMTTRDYETSYWVDLVDQEAESSQFVKLNCKLDLIERAQELSKSRYSCVRAVVDVVLELCYPFVDKYVEQKMGSLSETVREHLKLFVKGHDPEQDYYEYRRHAVVKLRKLISMSMGADEIQLKDGTNYVEACKDMTDRFTNLRPLREMYDTRTRNMTTHLPHVSFYDFCRYLVESRIKRDTDLFLPLDPKVERFFNALGQINQEDQKEWVKTAFLAVEKAKLRCETPLEVVQRLKKMCPQARDWIESWIEWLNSLAREHGYPLSGRSKEIERYSRYSQACMLLDRMSDWEILAGPAPKPESHRPRLNNPRRNRGLFKFFNSRS